jgi:hypothetical protein
MLATQPATAQVLVVKTLVSARCATSFHHDAKIVGSHHLFFVSLCHFVLMFKLIIVRVGKPINEFDFWVQR